MNRAVFLDKDGTVLRNVPFNVRPKEMSLTRRAAEGLRLLHMLGFELIVVTNQSGVARGYFEEEDLAGVRDRLRGLFREAGAELSGFYYCPHHPDGSISEYAIECDCRKPSPGLLLQAVEARQIRLSDCWLIGDTLDDVEAGHRAGCKAVLVDNGGETEWQMSLSRVPDFTVPDLYEAALAISRATWASMTADAAEGR